MTQRLLPGNPPVEITLKRSARARRFSLRVSRLDGRVTLSLPMRAREAEAMAFAEGQAGWLRKTLSQTMPMRAVGLGTEFPLEGQLVTVVPGTGRAARLEGNTLIVPADSARAGPRIAAYLKLAARARLGAACDHYAGLLGHEYSTLTLRDTRSRWGSCTTKGALMFSWRLILAPPEVLAYVAAHEVAHLAEMNHSPAFWRVVAQLMPEYRQHRTWLKRNGSALHLLDYSATEYGTD